MSSRLKVIIRVQPTQLPLCFDKAAIFYPVGLENIFVTTAQCDQSWYIVGHDFALENTPGPGSTNYVRVKYLE